MKLLVLMRFKGEGKGGRIRPIPTKALPQYRPDWYWLTGFPHAGKLIPADPSIKEMVLLGTDYRMTIDPMIPEDWEGVVEGQDLECWEAKKKVGDATVLKITK